MNKMESARRERGWSQAELARRCGMHPTTISLIESGRLRPGPSQIKRIAEKLGIEADALDVADSARC